MIRCAICTQLISTIPSPELQAYQSHTCILKVSQLTHGSLLTHLTTRFRLISHTSHSSLPTHFSHISQLATGSLLTHLTARSRLISHTSQSSLPAHFSHISQLAHGWCSHPNPSPRPPPSLPSGANRGPRHAHAHARSPTAASTISARDSSTRTSLSRHVSSRLGGAVTARWRRHGTPAPAPAPAPAPYRLGSVRLPRARGKG